VEIPVNKLDEVFRDLRCKVCGIQLVLAPEDGGGTAFANLAKAIRGFNEVRERVAIEFVLPDRSDQPARA
jgi:hypothetical protein